MKQEFKELGLWTLELGTHEKPPEAWLQMLSKEEHERCLRFYHRRDQLAYAAAHALLRCALGETLGISPLTLVFARDTRGRPYLNEPGNPGLDFNLSHTEGMAAVALSRRGRVGVDVEKVNRRLGANEELSCFGISPEEAKQLATCSEPEKNEGFLDLWTAREAVSKADGRGLGIPLNQIRINRETNTAEIIGDESIPASSWRLYRERPSPQHLLALATRESCLLTHMRSPL